MPELEWNNPLFMKEAQYRSQLSRLNGPMADTVPTHS